MEHFVAGQNPRKPLFAHSRTGEGASSSASVEGHHIVDIYPEVPLIQALVHKGQHPFLFFPGLQEGSTGRQEENGLIRGSVLMLSTGTKKNGTGRFVNAGNHRSAVFSYYLILLLFSLLPGFWIPGSIFKPQMLNVKWYEPEKEPGESTVFPS